MHGGRVLLESIPEQGSTFYVDLPCQGYLPSEVPTKFLNVANSDVQVTEPYSPLILFAEDNDANANSTLSYLRANDFRVMRAKNGLEAIAMAKMHHPNLILMDIQMPKLDGLEAMKMLKADPSTQNIPLIAINCRSNINYSS